jgi:hypothetical protein
VPVVTGATIPVDDPIVATPVAELVHVPPLNKLVTVALLPGHVAKEPAIADGTGLTVTTVRADNPPHGLAIESIIVVVPFKIPVTIPVVAPTVATPGLVLYHVPATLLEIIVVAPMHTTAVPVFVPMALQSC